MLSHAFAGLAALTIVTAQSSTPLYSNLSSSTTSPVSAVTPTVPGVVTPIVLATTFSSSAPVSLATSSPAGFNIDGKSFYDVGCGSVSSSVLSFFYSTANNTLESCIASIAALNYTAAAISGPDCYGSNTDLAAASNATQYYVEGTCTTACPGDSSEICGGESVGMKMLRRQAATPYFSVYQQYDDATDVPPPVTVVIPANAAPITVTIPVYTYYTVCSTGPITTTLPAYTTTITHCGCTDVSPATPTAPPLTTVVGTCGCGKNGALSTYTVTVPVAVATATGTGAMSSTTAMAATPYTGGARSNAVAGLLGAAGLGLALL